jgi:glycosyltransferase involved in cell wall biosynthesis
MDVSIVVPAYNEEESLKELALWIEKVAIANKLETEVLFIDDGSTDKSWQIITELKDSIKGITIRGFKFQRNYGKSPALYTGFKAVEGDVVITMDADLQDSPEEIPGLYNMITKEGLDIVSGWKKKRYDPFVKRFTSKFYNWTARKASGIYLHDFNCGLKAYRKEVVKSIEVYGEMHRYIPIIAKDAGFKKIGEKVVQHQARKYGVTKFGLDRFVNGFLDLMTLSFISKFGKRPMHFFGLLGSGVFFLGVVSALIIGIKKLLALSHLEKVSLITDSPFFYLSLIAMVIGAQMFLTGFLAELTLRNSTERNDYSIETEI